jgi:hypothetical protein
MDGDLGGDGYPEIVENETGDGLPWVVWDREIGLRRLLVWSRWTGEAWSTIRAVEGTRTGQSHPDLAFNSAGRAYMAFEQETSDGRGEIRFSIFLKTVWATTIQVSRDDEDASNPVLTIVDDETVEISYSLSDGSSVTRTVTFPDPGTITDDVYPFLKDAAVINDGSSW